MCTKCGAEKPLSAYGKQKGGWLGLHPTCKECRQAGERARYAANREEILARQKVSPGRLAYRKQVWRRKKYGISNDDFVAMVQAQGGRCAICHEKLDDLLVVDHDHVTGVVRALLCRMCNVGLGHFRDDPALLRAAADHLEAKPHTPFAERAG